MNDLWTDSLQPGDLVILNRNGKRETACVAKLDQEGFVHLAGTSLRFPRGGDDRDLLGFGCCIEPATTQAVEVLHLQQARDRVSKLWNQILDVRFPKTLAKRDLDIVEEALTRLSEVLHRKPEPSGVL